MNLTHEFFGRVLTTTRHDATPPSDGSGAIVTADSPFAQPEGTEPDPAAHVLLDALLASADEHHPRCGLGRFVRA